MKKTSRKIKYAIAFLSVCLLAFIGFSKAGILFSENGGNIITVSTTKKTFDPNNYVASAVAINKKIAASTTTTTTTATTTTTTRTTWTGEVLSRNNGVVFGPSGKETYYDLDMSGVIATMRNIGYSENDYPYWVRSDGVKMLGQYVMIAADFNTRPRGTIIESSLGFAIVCDTGLFSQKYPTQIDIAVTW